MQIAEIFKYLTFVDINIWYCIQSKCISSDILIIILCTLRNTTFPMTKYYTFIWTSGSFLPCRLMNFHPIYSYTKWRSRFLMSKNFSTVSYKSFSEKTRKCIFWPKLVFSVYNSIFDWPTMKINCRLQIWSRKHFQM
jgi:hypothetical protein